MEVLTDIGLTLKVKAALIADERIGSGDINVDTQDGVVTLRGAVPNHAIRELVEAVAARSGAQRIVNELQVSDPDPSPPRTAVPESFEGVTTSEGAPPRLEPTLEEAVRDALERDQRVNAHLLIVEVDNKVAYLSGRQETVEAHDAAIETAAHVPGVLAVSDAVDVAPSV